MGIVLRYFLRQHIKIAEKLPAYFILIFICGAMSVFQRIIERKNGVNCF